VSEMGSQKFVNWMSWCQVSAPITAAIASEYLLVATMTGSVTKWVLIKWETSSKYMKSECATQVFAINQS
jgi:hypothetical protein